MSARKTFRQFLNDTGGGVSAGDFELGARDAFGHYKYIWDVLRFRQGGVWNLWKRMPPQTYHEMADDWAEANPNVAHLKEKFWQPEIIQQLGFHIDPNGFIQLPK